MKNKQNLLQGIRKNIKRNEIHEGMQNDDIKLQEKVQIDYSKYSKLNYKLRSFSNNLFKKIFKAKMKVEPGEEKEIIKDGQTILLDKINTIWTTFSVNKDRRPKLRTKKYLEEISKLQKVTHPNFCNIFDFWTSDTNIHVISEEMTEGSLRKYLNTNGPLQIDKLKNFGLQILEGLEFLHKQKICHKNLKLNNIFVTKINEQEIIKIGDIGFFEKIDPQNFPFFSKAEFLPREIFEGQKYSPESDIYSFGLVMLELCTNLSPYEESTSNFDLIKKKLFGHLPSSIQKLTDNCLKHLIFRCSTSLVDRIKFSELKNHHFFTGEKCIKDCIPNKPGISIQISQNNKKQISSLIAFEKENVHLQFFIPEKETFVKLKMNSKKGIVQEQILTFLKKDKKLKITSRNILAELKDLIKKSFEQTKKIRNLNYEYEGIFNIAELEAKQIQLNQRFMIDQTQSYPYIGPLMPDDEIPEEVKILDEKPLKFIPNDISHIINAKRENLRFFSEPNSKEEFFKNNSESDQENNQGFYLESNQESTQENEKEHDYIKNLEYVEKKFINESELVEGCSCKDRRSFFDTLHSPGVYQCFCFDAFEYSSGSEDCKNENENLDENELKEKVTLKTNTDQNGVTEEIKNESEKIPENNKEVVKENNKESIPEKDKEVIKETNPEKDKEIVPETVQENNNEVIKEKILENNKEVVPETILNKNKEVVPENNKEIVPEKILEKDKEIVPETDPENCECEEEIKKEEIKCINCNSVQKDEKIQEINLNDKIENFVHQTALTINRSPESALEWIKLLKEQEIETANDLNILVEEDWDKLSLPVFAARAMKNSLFGKDKQPVKENYQLSNSEIPDFSPDLKIKEFIESVCKLLNKPENAPLWEAKLTNQEIRTVGEFKSLHLNDWDKLGLSVFCYRILKNVLNKKGKI